MGIWRTHHGAVRSPGESGHCFRFRRGGAGRCDQSRRAADGPNLSRLADSSGQKGVRAPHWDFLATDLRFLSSGSCGIRNLLRHLGLSNDCVADGTAIAAIEELERPKQFRLSAYASERIQRLSGNLSQHFCYRSEFPPGLRAELAMIAAT